MLDKDYQDVQVDSQVEQPTGTEVKTPAPEVQAPEGVTEPTPEVQPSPELQDNSIEIEGIGKVTPEDLKEWKQGYLRQSDYTKKTQEIASQRKQMQDAVELYEYLRQNPHVAKRLQEADEGGSTTPIENQPQALNNLDPALQRVEQLERMFAQETLDREINSLKDKYPDFDEVKVLTEAERRGISDLEFIYKATKEVDETNLREQIKREIMQEIENNKNATTTIISHSDKPATQQQTELTPAQQRVARGMGLSDEDYTKWMNG